MADFYFGNLATGLQKRPAPETGMGASPVGESDSMSFTNGGAFVSQSEGTHREFDLSWAVQEKSVMNFLNDYRNGVYGTGLLYMVDPFATNVLPPHWANPGLTCKGWPSLLSPAVQPAVAPAAVVTNLATNPRMLTTGAPVTVRTNLVSNPKSASQASMIVAGGTFGTGGAGTVARVNTPGFIGTGVTRMTVTTAPTAIAVGTDLLIADIPNRPAVAPGEAVALSAYVRSTKAQRVRIQAQFMTGAGAGIGTAQGADTTLVPNTWTRLTVVAIAPATTGLVRLDIDYASSAVLWAVGDTFDVDALLVEKSNVVFDYFDGDTVPSGPFTYAWSTTANASWSLQQGVSVAGAWTSAQATAYQISDTSALGGKAARYQINVAATSAFGTDYTAVPATVVGSINTIVVRFRTSWTGFIRARVRSSDQAQEIKIPVTAGAWQTVTRTQVSNTATGYVGLVGRSGDGFSMYDTVDVDSVLFVGSDYTGPYFDGSTVFIDGNKGAWTGAVDASTSTLARTPGNMPNTGARYTLTGEIGSVPTRMLTLMIPEDRDLYLGFSGTATNGGVLRMRTITRDGSYGPVQDLTLLDPAGTTRLNTKVAGGAYRAVQVYMTTTLPGAATITLVSGKAIYALPTETPDLTGGHMEGEGHTGVRFDGAPTMVYVQAAKGRKLVSTAAKFTEVGAWV